MSSIGQFVSRATGRANTFLSTLLERDNTIESFLEAANPKDFKNGELVYAKNNVCVHVSPPNGSVIHIGGYFALYFKSGKESRSGLLLHWLANDSFFDSTCRGELGSPVIEERDSFESRPLKSLPKLESQPALSSIPGKRSTKEQTSFFVDLTTVKRLRFFYTDSFQSAGAFLLISQENQTKVFHFHTGGLDRLANVIEQFCSLFEEPKHKRPTSILSSIQEFYVRKPPLRRGDSVTAPLPPEEVVEPLTKVAWFSFVSSSGEVLNEAEIRKRVFFKPLSDELRRYIWPFLVGVYQFESTHEQREAIRNDTVIEYHRCTKVRNNMDDDIRDSFWRQVASTVEKDVVRTDRSNPLFAGANNPNCTTLQNALLNTAVCEPAIGYTQGMSDLLATFFGVFDGQEADMFGIFRRFLHTSFFVSPKDRTIDEQLNYLRCLIKMFAPIFYGHLLKTGDAMDLLFCHRWILLFFKREFSESDLLRIWDCCFSCPDTAYFHLFVALAIITNHGSYVVNEKFAYDETLLYFNELGGRMNGENVLAKARMLLRAFRRLDRIPCSLYPLLRSAHSTGQWDSSSMPAVQCTADHLHQRCPFDAFVIKETTEQPQPTTSDSQ